MPSNSAQKEDMYFGFVHMSFALLAEADSSLFVIIHAYAAMPVKGSTDPSDTAIILLEFHSVAGSVSFTLSGGARVGAGG